MSTQLRPHCTVPPQSATQAPRRQTRPGAQATPQAPQFAGSSASATHAPPHDVEPAGQTHRPAVQVWLGAQTAPQAPQLRASSSSITHARPHAVRPALHDDAHEPRSQTVVALQAISHLPQ